MGEPCMGAPILLGIIGVDMLDDTDNDAGA